MARSTGATTLTEEARAIGRGNRVMGILVAICMIILGILFLTAPVPSEYVAMIFATIGFIIYGIYQIITYVRTPHDYKNGWVLADGIVFVILGALILTDGPADMFMTFAFLLGFCAMFEGIMQCTAYGSFRRAGEPGAGWVLASGIINLILSVMLIMWPFISTTALAMVLGVYLIIGGIGLFVAACSGRYGLHV